MSDGFNTNLKKETDLKKGFDIKKGFDLFKAIDDMEKLIDRILLGEVKYDVVSLGFNEQGFPRILLNVKKPENGFMKEALSLYRVGFKSGAVNTFCKYKNVKLQPSYEKCQALFVKAFKDVERFGFDTTKKAKEKGFY